MKWLLTVLTTFHFFVIPSIGLGQEAPAGLMPPPAPSSFEVIDFERRQFSVQRVRGMVYVDGVKSANDVVENQSQEIRLIEFFDGLDFANTRSFRSWAKTLRGTRTYTYDNVSLRHPDGTVTTSPLVLLPEDQRATVDVVWSQWVAEQRRLAAQQQQIVARQKAEQDRIAALQNVANQQAANAQRLVELERRIDREARIRAYFRRPRVFFVPQVVIENTGTGLGVGGNGIGFVSGNFISQSGLGFSNPRIGINPFR